MADKWFPLSLSSVPVAGGFDITLVTDVPSHLYLYWTDKEPWVHRRASVQRGLAVPWHSYWCFVVWHIIEQEEAGDTTTHTFIWRGWQVCQTKWFRFHGTIAGQPSPSDSPIFHLHYTFVPPVPGMMEECIIDKWPDIYGLRDDLGSGYSFIAQSSYTMSHIIMWFTKTNNPGDLDFKLYAADAAWKPTGPVLATGSIDDTGILAWPNRKQKIVPMTETAIVAGQKYSICALTPTSSHPNYWALWWSTVVSPNCRIISTVNGWIGVSVGPANTNMGYENWGY